MLGFKLIGTLGALAFTSAAYGQEPLALLNAEEPAPAAKLVDPLIPTACRANRRSTPPFWL